jgi:hypothetical protein
MDAPRRHYHRELALALVAYTIALVISNVLLRAFPGSALQPVIALIPMLPAAAIPLVIVRLLRRLDELQRRIQLEALGFAFGGTAVLTFGYGFLQGVGFPAVSWFAIWPLMAMLWLLGCFLAGQRYR